MTIQAPHRPRVVRRMSHAQISIALHCNGYRPPGRDQPLSGGKHLTLHQNVWAAPGAKRPQNLTAAVADLKPAIVVELGPHCTRAVCDRPPGGHMVWTVDHQVSITLHDQMRAAVKLGGHTFTGLEMTIQAPHRPRVVRRMSQAQISIALHCKCCRPTWRNQPLSRRQPLVLRQPVSINTPGSAMLGGWASPRFRG